jgi:elongation factor P
MVNVNDIKNGMTIEVDGNIFTILEFQHVKPGKGAAFVKMKLKNLRTGSIVEQTFNSSTKVGKAMIEKKTMQYLYSDGDNYVFMDMNDYSQIELPQSQIEEESKYLTENAEVDILYYGSEMLGVNLPEKVELEVVRTEPGIKGNTATTATKEAELNTGLVVRVPLFIEQGERILVTTADGKYSSRA